MEPHPFKQLFPEHPHCIEGLTALQSGISCGRLEDDPIHETPERYDARRSAERPDPLNVLRGIVAGYVPNTEESYGIAMRACDEIRERRVTLSDAVAELRREFDKIEWVEATSTGPDTWIDILDRIESTITPPEARTGISDRNAAALTDVAEMRRKMTGMQGGTLMLVALDRIEQALRADGAA